MNLRSPQFLGASAFISIVIPICVGFLSGCGGKTAAFFYRSEHTQAIHRDTVTASGLKTTIENPQDSVNGIVRIAPVESLNLQPATIEVPAEAALHAPFDVPRTLMVPPGFSVQIHAHGLGRLRDLALRKDGTLFYSDIDGVIGAIKPDGSNHIVVEGLNAPHGLELHNGSLYFTEENTVSRFDFSSPTDVTGTRTVINNEFPDAAGNFNYTRTIRWSPEDQLFYVSVGATTNRDVEDDPYHAVVFGLSEDGSRRDVRMRGLRSTIAMDIHPSTGELWGLDDGTDDLAKDLPPIEVNILKTGRHYGWPFYYSQEFSDPDYMEGSIRKPAATVTPIIELQAHSGPTDMHFYEGTALGPEWNNAMIIVFSGSQQRVPPTGFKVVRVRSEIDGSEARQADMVTGFIGEQGEAWGLPVGIAIGPDGKTFYLSDERNGAIYKIFKP